MDKKQLSLAAMSVAVLLLGVTFVTANPLTSTPLYTVRMEQQSSEMSFLPTEMNEVTYTTENGYTLNYNAPLGCCGDANPLGACTYYATTCCSSCYGTCSATCPLTCYTCPATCTDTCPNTCGYSCGQVDTCNSGPC
ncbi:MAG: hypothetical protein HXS48_01120 [Theionarchaea archaeon]|nr:MAG: hypothetical protein AYK19_03785 [Theionarchaea archaeon DG-70-1]MBU7025512.1 hypothetical protein [Theionarchaea archaeon]